MSSVLKKWKENPSCASKAGHLVLVLLWFPYSTFAHFWALVTQFPHLPPSDNTWPAKRGQQHIWLIWGQLESRRQEQAGSLILISLASRVIHLNLLFTSADKPRALFPWPTSSALYNLGFWPGGGLSFFNLHLIHSLFLYFYTSSFARSFFFLLFLIQAFGLMDWLNQES